MTLKFLFICSRTDYVQIFDQTKEKMCETQTATAVMFSDVILRPVGLVLCCGDIYWS